MSAASPNPIEPSRSCARACRGMTLMELLVVIAIIGLLLPHLGQMPLWNQFIVTVAGGATSAAVQRTVVPEYVCPSWPSGRVLTKNTAIDMHCDGLAIVVDVRPGMEPVTITLGSQ